MNVKKLHKFLAITISCLLVFEALDYYYQTITIFNNNGLPPQYGIWFEFLIKIFFLIILLNINKTSFLAYLYLIFTTMFYFINFGQAPFTNPFYLWHMKDFAYLLNMIFDVIEFLLSILGLIIWLWLNFRPQKLNPKTFYQ
jgi:hypothetical protein